MRLFIIVSLVLLVGVGVTTDVFAAYKKTLRVTIKTAYGTGGRSAGKGSGTVRIDPPGTICRKSVTAQVVITGIPPTG
jgi:hypothetical protein